MSEILKSKNWDDFLLPNGKTVGFMRSDNITWWLQEGQDSERPEVRKNWYDVFLSNAKQNNPNFSFENYAGKNLKVGEACGGPYGGIIEMYLSNEDKYQIDIFADSFKSLNWISSDISKTTWVETPCEQICLDDDFLDVVFAFNSIDHGWDVFSSMDELVRVSKEVYLSFDTNRYLRPGYPDLNHYQIVDLNKVIEFVEGKYFDKDKYDAKYTLWRPAPVPSPDDQLVVFDLWVKKK